MVPIEIEKDNLHFSGIWTAVPRKPKLKKIIAKAGQLKNELFPYSGMPPHVVGYKSLLEEEGEFTDLTFTYSTQPPFMPDFYKLPNRNLDGYTTLQISALGTSRQQTHCLVEKVLSLFPEPVEMTLQDQIEKKITAASYGILEDYAEKQDFFSKYLSVKEKLSDIKKRRHKGLEKGVIITTATHALRELGVILSPTTHDVRLVNRVTGNYENRPLELALTYITGPQVQPGVYGTTISIQHKEGCPSWEKKICDKSRAVAGLFLTPQHLLVGGTKLRPDLGLEYLTDQESGPVGRKDFCEIISNILPIASSQEEINTAIDVLKGRCSMSDSEAEDIIVLARIVQQAD